MNTDTVIFTQKSSETILPTGNYLGEFTSELESENDITEYVAAGPKNCAYVTQRRKQWCKLRGFTPNERGQQVLHLSSMKDLVLNEILGPVDQSRTLTLNNLHW